MDPQTQQNLYLQNQLQTASPEGMMGMLLGRCQRAVRDMVASLEKPQPEQNILAVQKVCDILNFLLISVAQEPQSELQQNLIRLYTYCLGQVKEAYLAKNLDAARRILGVLEPVLNAYQQKAQQGEGAGLQPQHS